MKINLGSGYTRFEGFTNIDDDMLVEPDILLCLDSEFIRIPVDDNSVDEIKAHHILEHIGTGFIPLMQELYRVAKHGCIFDIKVPHHFHDAFYGDPTHKRHITVSCMNMFSKKFNTEQIKQFGSSSGMGLKYNVDWEMVWFDFKYDEFYRPLIDKITASRDAGTLSEQDHHTFQRLMREATNVAIETHIKMVAIKE
jgi:hypothetical protein